MWHIEALHGLAIQESGNESLHDALHSSQSVDSIKNKNTLKLFYLSLGNSHLHSHAQLQNERINFCLFKISCLADM